jgi:hypothetical protein
MDTLSQLSNHDILGSKKKKKEKKEKVALHP